jgi:hypothetical protein
MYSYLCSARVNVGCCKTGNIELLGKFVCLRLTTINIAFMGVADLADTCNGWPCFYVITVSFAKVTLFQCCVLKERKILGQITFKGKR